MQAQFADEEKMEKMNRRLERERGGGGDSEEEGVLTERNWFYHIRHFALFSPIFAPGLTKIPLLLTQLFSFWPLIELRKGDPGVFGGSKGVA